MHTYIRMCEREMEGGGGAKEKLWNVDLATITTTKLTGRLYNYVHKFIHTLRVVLSAYS